MISALHGRIAAKGENYVIVDVGGVGFRVFVPSSSLERFGGVGQEISLFTHMHVRENELALYGFGSPDELQLFELLLGVSGIGPKVGLKIVSIMSVETLREAIATGDAAMLTRIPGIGKKIAEAFDADDEELTRTGKVRRRFIYGLYIKLIEAMYGNLKEVHVRGKVHYRDGQIGEIETNVKIINVM